MVSGVMITFASVAFLTWGTDFVVRYKDFSLREAGISLGPALLVSGLLGVLAGGFLADMLQKHFAFGRILTVACGFLIAAPFVCGPSPVKKSIRSSARFSSPDFSCRGTTGRSLP